MPARIPTPAVILDPQGNPSLIVEANGSGLLMLNPSTKIKRLNGDALSQQFGLDLTAVTIGRAGIRHSSALHELGAALPEPLQGGIGGGVHFQLSGAIVCSGDAATVSTDHRPRDRPGFRQCPRRLCCCDGVADGSGTDLRQSAHLPVHGMSNRVDISLGSAIVSRLLRLNIRYFEKHPVGELASRLNELDKIRSFLTGTALTVVLDALFAMLYFGVMFSSPILAGIILGSIPLLLLVILGLTPITQRLIRQRAEAYSKPSPTWWKC